jgi:hypothetical protein
MATSISANGATQYVSLRMNAGLVEYSTDQSTYMPIAATANWPVTITNANPGASSVLRVVAIENLTITGGYGGISGYLIAGSGYITFDGSGNTITLDGITNYPGFITSGGYGYIAVRNFTTTASGGSALGGSSGWLCQYGFGSNVSGISVTNCTNNGTIDAYGSGGIVGAYFGRFGSATITGCTNNGTIISQNSGGITGQYCGHDGSSVTITNCVNNGNMTTSNFSKGGIVGGESANNSSLNITGCTNNGTIAGGGDGGIVTGNSGYNNGTLTITNCTNTSTGIISGSSAGGIIGSNSGTISGSLIITGCTNSALISGFYAGGIAGNACGQNNGSLSINSCTNSGTISGTGAGGIVGANSGNNFGIVDISGCTNSGLISGGGGAGGIAGSSPGVNNGSCSINSCTNSGNIAGTGESAGGIAGSIAGGNTGSCTITNCISTGTIGALESGGIVGQNAGFNGGLCNITSCFSSGAITGRTSGGIAGNQIGCNTNQPCTITQCYSTGAISGTNAGGIAGGNIGRSADIAYSPVVNITNSYSLGAIATSCGGICGGRFDGSIVYTNPATINITNSYSFGLISGTGQGLVAASLTSPNINLTATNTYVANNNWTDASANAALTGTPTDVGLANKGTTWTSYPSANTPYLLSSYLPLTGAPQLYTPNSVLAYTNYTSSAGFYTSGTYSIASSSQADNIITLNVIRTLSTSPYYGYYSGTFALTNMNGNYTGGIVVTINSSSGVLRFVLPNLPCFLEGTKILCFENNQEVYRPIENLRKGDLVKTIYNGYVPINMMGTKSIYNPGNDYRVVNRLYKCSREKYPTLFEDLYITGCHSILVPEMTDDQWENTKAVNGTIFVTDNHFRLIACADEKAEPFNKEGFMNIYHIALEHHDTLMNYGIYANGLLVESCSERNLRELSNMRILGEEDCAVSENADKVPFNMDRELVEIY